MYRIIKVYRNKNMETIVLVIFIFSLIGLFDTLYLSYHKIQGTEVWCLFFPPEWCRKVQQSEYSKTFGIPNTFAGLGMYTILLVLLALFTGGSLPWWPIAAVVTFGFLFSMYFTYIQAFVLRAFCTWCVVSAINFTVMFVTVVFNYLR